MNPRLLFEQCLAPASLVVAQVNPAQFNQPTPDTEWDVRMLIGHMLSELSWVPDLLDGKTVAEVGAKYVGDLIGDNLPKNWQAAANKARRTIARTDLDRMVHLSYGDFPAKHYIREQANDQLIHAWDLGTAIGLAVEFDKIIAEDLYRTALPRRPEMTTSGLFGPEIVVADSADIQTKLLALFGRRAS